MRWAGWLDVLRRVAQQTGEDDLTIVAAGTAFYALLAVFPAMAAIVSLYGLFTDPQVVERQMQAVQNFLPQQAAQLLNQQLRRIASGAGAALGFGAAFGFVLAVWSSTKGVKALMTALNIVYGERERRGFLKLNALALLLTSALLVFVVVALVAITFVPAAIGRVGLPGPLEALARWMRWPLLAGASIVVIGAFYRYAVCRAPAPWRRVAWGAVAATALWLGGSALFSWYVSSFANYNQTYGSLGAVAVLMMWFWLSAYFVLLGGELNAEMERHVRRDAAAGRSQPLGRRGT